MKLDEVSKLYARLLQFFSLSGIALLLLTFGLYVFGIVPSRVAPARVSELWHLSIEEYAEETGGFTGWEWIKHTDGGESLAFAALVFLALSTVVCLIILSRSFAKTGDRRYLVIVIAQTIVLLIAASGVVTVY